MSTPIDNSSLTPSESANESRIVVRQAALSDREALWEFMKLAYDEERPGAVQYKIPVRWNWQFVENPFVKEQGGKLPIWIAVRRGEILGQMCAMPMQITIGGQTYNGAWGCDFIVLKKARGHGIGWRLNKAYCEHFQIAVHVTQAHETERIWKKIGQIAISPAVSIMWKIIRMNAGFVFRYLNNKTRSRPPLNRLFRIICRYFFLHHVIAFCANIWTRLQNAIRQPYGKCADCEITEVRGFDEEFSAFIDKASAGYDSIVKRNPEFLRWKYIDNPMVPYHSFLLKRNGEIKGYVVLRGPHRAELNIGIIADIFAARDDQESMKALVSHAIAFFGKRVNAIQVLVSIRGIANILRKQGFFRLRTYVSHFVCSDPALKEQLKGHTEDWFITFADHDQEQIRPVP